MDIQKLIGMRVRNLNTRIIGKIQSVNNSYIVVDFHGDLHKYSYPLAFTCTLELEDEDLQKEIQSESENHSFEEFKKRFNFAINNEINFLKATGGKKHKIIDGEKISSKNEEYIYSFETDTELHFPDGTAIKLWFPDKIV